jgi:hypothetical protein
MKLIVFVLSCAISSFVFFKKDFSKGDIIGLSVFLSIFSTYFSNILFKRFYRADFAKFYCNSFLTMKDKELKYKKEQIKKIDSFFNNNYSELQYNFVSIKYMEVILQMSICKIQNINERVYCLFLYYIKDKSFTKDINRSAFSGDFLVDALNEFKSIEKENENKVIDLINELMNKFEIQYY